MKVKLKSALNAVEKWNKEREFTRLMVSPLFAGKMTAGAIGLLSSLIKIMTMLNYIKKF